MSSSIILIAMPVISFLILLLIGAKLSRFMVSFLGTISIFLTSVFALYLLWQSFNHQGEREVLYTFLKKGLLGFEPVYFSLYLDTLSLTMCVTVSFVAAFIALYSCEYMKNEEGLCRFFASINLFVAFMLLLVLADNLWLLFIGWEGVGLCSYILIGFYYRETKAVHAAMKAFIMTRIGDVFLLFGLFLCFLLTGTLDIQNIIARINVLYPTGSTLITITALCFLGGAVGKSAQLPLQTWLADAMWGPTPVSALIHAATMVTAGVYLIARMSGLFLLAPDAQFLVGIIGLFTLVLAGCAALAQTDMKRVLAYSTMSQIGYMFLALGAAAYQAAIFHLVTHAFYKSLLFLSAGVIGHALHSYDLFHMGGLYRQMPKTFFLFLIGCVNLMGLPLISAGFFSKEWIMGTVLFSPSLGTWAFAIAVFGTFLTGLYTFRMIMLAFFGQPKQKVAHKSGIAIGASLFVLTFFSLSIGWLNTPHLFGNIHIMADFLSKSLPANLLYKENVFLLFTPALASIIGAILSIWLYAPWREDKRERIFPWSVRTLLKNGGAIDWFYMNIIVAFYVALSHRLKKDGVETLSESLTKTAKRLFCYIDRLHTGRITDYASFLIISALALAFVMVF